MHLQLAVLEYLDGMDVAELAAHLHEHVIESASYPSDPVAAFTEAFIKCDEEFVTKSKKSGTTAICSLIKGETIFTAWLGDSQAVLSKMMVMLGSKIYHFILPSSQWYPSQNCRGS